MRRHGIDSPRSVHPRIRGERVTDMFEDFLKPGSSPHARGTLSEKDATRLGRRFIPACAGNASAIAGGRRGQPVHPRMRGERTALREHPWPDIGSSPHARGTPNGWTPTPRRRRFIPACAGNAAAAPPMSFPVAVHPRMRGERDGRYFHRVATSGSSPHARGTRSNIADTCWRSAVHPRMRGERRPINANTGKRSGSSPHARGTQYSSHHFPSGYRFIPACAGNASEPLGARFPVSVHPRMRGERLRDIFQHKIKHGSSPHARGTQVHGDRRGGRQRFIPACAGNALPISY